MDRNLPVKDIRMRETCFSDLEVPIRVRYCETDKMGVVHHSNYIRYMEIARMAWLEAIGCPFTQIERGETRLMITEISCTYRAPATFDDFLQVHTILEKWNKFRLSFLFLIKKEGRIIAKGGSSLAAVSIEGYPAPLPEILLKRLSEIDVTSSQHEHD